jgi:hypothetical protein
MNFQKHFHSFNVDDVAYLLSFFDYFIAETHECIFIQISRETMLLLINNLHKNVRDNCSFNLRVYGEHSTGKVFLALLYHIIQR